MFFISINRNSMKNPIFLSLVILVPFVETKAQQSPYEVGIHAGMSLYQGDLIPTLPGSYKTPGLLIGINIARRMNRLMSVRADLSFAKLHASDANYSKPEWRQFRNLSFGSSVKELTVSMIYNVIGERRITPYVTGGAGLSLLNIKRDDSNFNAAYFDNQSWVGEGLTVDMFHRLPKLIIVLPVGAGARFPITEKLSVKAETTFRLMFTDYLDGFSHVANNDKKDHYFSHTVGVTYSWGKKNKALDCPAP